METVRQHKDFGVHLLPFSTENSSVWSGAQLNQCSIMAEAVTVWFCNECFIHVTAHCLLKHLICKSLERLNKGFVFTTTSPKSYLKINKTPKSCYNCISVYQQHIMVLLNFFYHTVIYNLYCFMFSLILIFHIFIIGILVVLYEIVDLLNSRQWIKSGDYFFS